MSKDKRKRTYEPCVLCGNTKEVLDKEYGFQYPICRECRVKLGQHSFEYRKVINQKVIMILEDPDLLYSL